MRLVWMIILLATGAMFLIAATLLVHPMESGQHPSYRTLEKVSQAACFFCEK